MKFSTVKDERITSKKKEKKLARTLWYQTRTGKFGMTSWTDRQTHTPTHTEMKM